MDKYILVGIDLGTSNSSISYWDFEKKEIKVLTDAMKKSIPSKIFLDETVSFGNYIPLNSRNNKKELIHSFKRLINSTESTDFTDSLSYDLKLANDKWIIKQKYSLTEILILFISHLKKLIIRKLGEYKIKAVITVPSNYNDHQRLLVKSCYEKNNIEVLRIINEPTAAALAYGLSGEKNNEQNILVFDLGGGTLDLSILEIDDNFFEAIGNGGDINLGGNDYTKVLYDYFLKETNSDLTNDDRSKLWYQSEKAKINLRYRNKVTLKIQDVVVDVTLETFQELIKPLIRKTIDCIDELLKNKNMMINEIDHIIMIGGSSKLLDIQNAINVHYGVKPMIYPNLENVVSNGACLQASLLEKVYQNSNEIILVDVLPLSLGIKTSDEIFSIIIPQNTPVPCKRTQKYIPSNIDETEIEIEVYEGIRNLAKDNYLVGKFIFEIDKNLNDSIIEVSFNINNNGILEISAKDLNNKNKKTVIMNQVSKMLDKEQLENYIELAEKQSESDLTLEKRQKMVYQLENMIIIIKDNLISESVKIPDNQKEKILDELDLIENSIELQTETKLLKIIKKLEDNYTNLLIISGNEGYVKMENYDELDDQISFSKETLIERVQYYISIQENESDILTKYLVESLKEIEEIDSIDKLTKKELEIEENINKVSKVDNYDELISLCNFLLEEIQSGEIDVNKTGVDLLLNKIQEIFDLKNKKEDNYYLDQIKYINKLCNRINNI